MYHWCPASRGCSDTIQSVLLTRVAEYRLVAGFFSGFAFSAVSTPGAGEPLPKKLIACFNSGVLFALAQGAFYQVSALGETDAHGRRPA